MRLGLPPEVASVLLRMAGRLDQATTYEAMLTRALAASASRPPARGRDRHGMHIVRDGAACGVLVGACRWVWRTRAHRVAAGAVTAALAAATVLTPGVATPAHPAPALAHTHSHHRLPLPPAPSRAARAAATARPKPRRRRADADTGHPSGTPVPSQSPDPAPSPAPSQAPSPPLPVPLPSVSVTLGLPPVGVGLRLAGGMVAIASHAQVAPGRRRGG